MENRTKMSLHSIPILKSKLTLLNIVLGKVYYTCVLSVGGPCSTVLAAFKQIYSIIEDRMIRAFAIVIY